MLVIDTERFNGSKVDANADAGTGYAALVPGNKSGGGDDQGLLPVFIRTIVGRCWPFGKKPSPRKEPKDYSAPVLTKDQLMHLKDGVEGTLKHIAKEVTSLRVDLHDVYQTVTRELTPNIGINWVYPFPDCGEQVPPFLVVFRDLPRWGPDYFKEAIVANEICTRDHSIQIGSTSRDDEACAEKFCSHVKALPTMIEGAGKFLGEEENKPLGDHYKYAAACCKLMEEAK